LVLSLNHINTKLIMNSEFQKMFHAYDHQLIYPSVVPFSYFNDVGLFIQQWIEKIDNALPLNDFYFLGTLVLLYVLFCMFQIFLSMLDLVLAHRDELATRIVSMNKRIVELEAEQKILKI